MFDVSSIPVRGKLMAERDLSTLTWLRVGGPADWFFMPADVEDLRAFLKALPQEVPIFPMGVGSNLIVRDGGIRGVVIRLGRAFAEISTENGEVRAGAAALDAQVAKKAADTGLDLTFLRTIPGSIGGAVRMNAGCYGSYVADHFVRGRVMDRSGNLIEMYPADLNFAYRSTTLPPDSIVVDALLRADRGEPEALAAKMEDQLAKRDASQPTKDLTAGSTFRNPAGFSSTGQADDSHELKAWKVIDDAGLRGATRGGAMMSKKHPNFLTNTGTATAADLEGLGEEVREKVAAHSGITLEWEIMRVGEPAPEAKER